MNKKHNNSDSEILRQKAEDFLKKKSSRKASQLSEVEMLKLIHELDVHQVELEMQNEELMHAKEQLAKAAADKYAELYDAAPSGYFTLSQEGEITEINLTGASMLGKERSLLTNSRFGFFISDDTRPVFNLFLEKAFSSKAKETAEVTLQTSTKLPLYVHLTGIVNQKGEQCLVTAADISKLRQVEQAVKESEEKYRNVFAAERDSLFLIDRETRAILDVNDAACGLYGYSWQEMLKLKNSDLSSEPEETKRATAEFRDRIDLRYHKKKDGTIFPVEISASLFILKDKEVILASIHDITTRVQAELLMRQNDTRLKEAQAVAKVGSWETDLSTSKVIWSDETYRIFGIDHDSFPNSHPDFLEFVHPDDRVKVDEAYAGSIGTKSVHAIELRIITPKGLIKFIEERWHILYNDQGQPSKAVGTCQDITERKQTEEELQQAYTRLALAARASGVGVWDYDIVNNILLWDDQMFELYGIDKKNFKGAYEAWRKVIHPDDAARGDQEYQMALHGEKEYNTEFRVLVPDGTIRYIRALAVVQRDDSGKPLRMIGTNWDITSLKNIERQLRKSEANLKKNNAEKDKFFSIIAHDLRGPFNGFLGLSKMMAEELPTLTVEQVQRMASGMRNSAANLYNLLENLLEWSRLQRGITPFEPEPFLLMSMMAESMRPVMDSANKKEIEISYEIPADLEVFADKYMLASTIRNLASNAVKFTRKGGKVTISAKPAPGHSVEISVRDTGIGMSPQMVAGLFRLDVKSNRKGTDNEPSTGLGLLLCKDFVEKYGGKLWVKSEEGKGSVFYFTIPYHVKD